MAEIVYFGAGNSATAELTRQHGRYPIWCRERHAKRRDVRIDGAGRLPEEWQRYDHSPAYRRLSAPVRLSLDQTEGLHLRRRPFVTEDYGDGIRIAAGPRAQLAGRLQAQMTVHYLTVASGELGNFEAEFPNAAAHAVNHAVVLAWVARVEK